MTTTQQYVQTLAELLRGTLGPLGSEELPLHETFGRRLGVNVVTRYPSPRFDNSQMDGYGLSYANLGGGRFRVGPDVAAGADPAQVYPYGINGYGHDTAVPIMTGAQIPEDVVAIIPVEDSTPAQFVETGHYVQLPATDAGRYIRPTGSDMPAGTALSTVGARVDAALIGAAAAQGFQKLTVVRKPRIALITGGNEVHDNAAAQAATVYDANTPLATALGVSHGMDVVATVKISDDQAGLRRALDTLISHHTPDVIVTSGGISAGKYEVIRQFLNTLTTSWVGAIRQQPGGPQGYGVYGKTPIIALPGNPISTLVSLRMLVIPALWEAFGASYEPVSVQATVYEQINGLPAKTQYRRALLGTHHEQLVAQLQGEPGSHLLAQAVGANSLVEIPAGATVRPGDQVTAHLYADTQIPHTFQPPVKETTSQPDNAAPQNTTKTALVIVSSTRAAQGIYQDDVGPALVSWLRAKGYETPQCVVVTDAHFASTLNGYIGGDENPLADVIITSGGTGISPTDTTVETVEPLLDQHLPHVMTAILYEGLKNTPRAALSRGVAGVIGQSFIVTLPGSVSAAQDGMKALDPILDHIVEQLRGEDH